MTYRLLTISCLVQCLVLVCRDSETGANPTEIVDTLIDTAAEVATIDPPGGDMAGDGVRGWDSGQTTDVDGADGTLACKVNGPPIAWSRVPVVCEADTPSELQIESAVVTLISVESGAVACALLYSCGKQQTTFLQVSLTQEGSLGTWLLDYAPPSGLLLPPYDDEKGAMSGINPDPKVAATYANRLCVRSPTAFPATSPTHVDVAVITDDCENPVQLFRVGGVE